MYWVRMFFTQADTHLHAIAEVAVTALFSLAPLLLAIVLPSVQNADGSFLPLSSVAGRGQIFLLVYGLYGTIFWLGFANWEYPRHNARFFLGFVGTLVIWPIVAFSGIDPTFSTILNPNLITISYWTYGIFLGLNYLLLFYMKIDPPEPQKVFERGTIAMRDQYRDSQDAK